MKMFGCNPSPAVLLLALLSTAVTAQEACDIVQAVHCFAGMQNLPQVQNIADDAQTDIIQPCEDQKDIMTELENCLAPHIVGCPSIGRDVNASISETTWFCDSILGECEDHGGFEQKYKGAFTCMSAMFDAMASGNQKEQCSEFATCLEQTGEGCAAVLVSSMIINNWLMFRPMCLELNATNMLPDDYFHSIVPHHEMACEKLGEVAMGIDMCFDMKKADLESAHFNITTYCSITHSFDACVVGLLESNECAELNAIYNASMLQYKQAIAAFCEPAVPDQEPAMLCEMGAVQDCFKQLGSALWRMEEMLMIGTPGVTIEGIRDKAGQITDLVMNLVNTCDDVESQITATETCMESSIGGCPDVLSDLLRQHVTFIRTVCDDLDNCTGAESFNTALDTCVVQANTQLHALATDESLADILAFTQHFCGAFHELFDCMYTLMQPCAGQSAHMHAFFTMITNDLEPICNATRMRIELQLPELNDDMQSLVDCSDLVVKTHMIGECDRELLTDMFSHPTNPQRICQQVDAWAMCYASSGLSECSLLTDTLRMRVQGVRAHLQGACPEPTTQPPPGTGEEGVEGVTTPTNSTVDGDNGAGLTRISLALVILQITLLSLIV